MWSPHLLRLVGGRSSRLWSVANLRLVVMLSQAFEERLCVTSAAPASKLFSTLQHEKCSFSSSVNSTSNVDEEYEEAIKTLNTLQSNADTINRSITFKNKVIPLTDTIKYLNRSELSLEKIEELPYIHVSGTKGKGSTCSLTESILRAHGIKTGFFSSPHLIAVTERIRINGEPISKQKFKRAFWRIFKRLESAQSYAHDMPAYFKFLTILCFHIFLEEKVDVAILEVGIGGEFDCTNIIRNTKTVGITSLGLEHTQILGDTLEDIAWQKAGIIKPQSHVYTTVDQPECLQVIQQRAKAKNATVHIVPPLSTYANDPDSQAMFASLNNITQLNGSLAVQLAYDWMRHHRLHLKENFAVDSAKLSDTTWRALASCNWPGRCQILKLDNFNIYLDGAHTVESISVCGDWFARVAKNSANPKILIFNTTGLRDAHQLLRELRSKCKFDLVCFVPNLALHAGNNKDNQSSLYGVAEQIQRTQIHETIWQTLCTHANEESNNTHTFTSILDCLEYMRKRYGAEKQVDLLVTGSLHLVGCTMVALNEFVRMLDLKSEQLNLK